MLVPLAILSGSVGAAGKGMRNQDGIILFIVECPVCFEGKRDRAQCFTGPECELVKGEELGCY